jgi:hypothetical protein
MPSMGRCEVRESQVDLRGFERGFGRLDGGVGGVICALAVSTCARAACTCAFAARLFWWRCRDPAGDGLLLASGV